MIVGKAESSKGTPQNGEADSRRWNVCVDLPLLGTVCPAQGQGRRKRTKLELWSCGSQVFTNEPDRGGQAVWCLCSENPSWRQNILFVQHMVKLWVLDLGEEWGKTTTKAEFFSGVAVNEAVLKGSWPLRCRGEGAG